MLTEQRTLIDAHCHIDLYKTPELVAEASGSLHIHTIAVTNTPSVYPYTESLARKFRYIYPAIGLHPVLVASRSHELPQMWRALAKTEYVGEIGLDYHASDETDRRIQRHVFGQILAHCAEYGNKVLSIHSRRATQDVIDAIGENYSGRVILHWYSGSVRELSRAASYGFFFSVNSAMLKSQKGQSLITRMPKERILTETDGPFVKVAGEPARPEHIRQILESLGKLWNVGFDEALNQVASNLRDLLQKNTNEVF